MTLSEIRTEIDQLDGEIVLLLNKRFASVLKSQIFKTALTDTKREEEILTRIASPYFGPVKES